MREYIVASFDSKGKVAEVFFINETCPDRAVRIANIKGKVSKVSFYIILNG